MGEYSLQQLKERSFQRVAMVLHHFWEEQKFVVPRAARVHSRVFDTLVHDSYIYVGKSKNGTGYREHLVPCVYIRDLSFEMYWSGSTVQDVAEMIGRLLRIAQISPADARRMDVELGLKTKMPSGWHPKTGSVFARLEKAGIFLELE